MKKYFPMMKTQGGENGQAKSSDPNPDAPKKNCFYVLQSRSDQEISLDVVTRMLKIFSFDVCSLFYLGATFSFVTPLVTITLKYYPIY